MQASFSKLSGAGWPSVDRRDPGGVGRLLNCIDGDGHAHEFCKIASPHLGHHVGAVDLNRARADAEMIGDHFVLQAIQHAGQNLMFAVRELTNSCCDTFAIGNRATRPPLPDCQIDRCD